MKPNIFFIIIDSFRGDKFYDKSKTSKTPNFDFLRNNGVYFNQTFSAADGTVLSWASIITGLYPFKTGVTAASHYSIDSNVPHLIKILKKEGYHAYATVPELTFLSGMTDQFENDDKFYNNYYELSQGLGNEIVSKLESKSMKEPWFYYLHINDLHIPNWPSKQFDSEEYGSNNYERVISEIDFWIGKFLQKIDLEKTLIVVTADHGDYISFIQKNQNIINFEAGISQKFLRKFSAKLPRTIRLRFTHPFNRLRNKILIAKVQKMNLTPYEKRSLLNTRKDSNYLFDEMVHVPLVLAGYNIKHRDPVNNLVRTIDIFPTLLEIIGLTKRGDIDGKSLFSLIKGKNLEEIPVYFERDIILKKTDEDVIGIRTSEYKYFRSVGNPKKRVNLYNIKKDPLEEKNIAEEEPSIVSKMEDHLLQILSKKEHEPTPQKVDDEYSKKVEKELRKLGYI